ncbi:glycoside hydrolase 3 protein [Aphanomyces cochlioides]|nr:glycoside hydrolase 3 protein [Aphanomyces cochlioides]
MKVSSPALLALAATSVVALDTKFYGLNYDTRTNEWGGCKDDNTMAADFNIIKRVSDRLRIYSMNYDCTKRILQQAQNAGLKVWIGLWSEIPDATTGKADSFPSQMANLRTLTEESNSLIRNDNVLGVHVSSEALYRYYVQGAGNSTSGGNDRKGIDLIVSHLNEARSYLRAKGLTFPVVVTDIMDMYTKFPELYEATDVVAENQFSFWQNISPEDGTHFFFKRHQEELTRAKRAGKLLVVQETGWSTDGTNPVVTEASPLAQGVFTQDYLTLVSRQNVQTYYFSAFDLGFGTDNIEKSFGIHTTDRVMKPAVSAVNVGPRLTAVRLWSQGYVIKADRHWNSDDTVNWNYGRLYVEKPSSGRSGKFDDEIWLWDSNSKMLYSKSADVCLDTYGDNNQQTVHTWYCSKNNANQQWNAANNNLASLNSANFCLDVDLNRAKTSDGKLVPMMYPCTGNGNQKIQVVAASEDPLEFSIHGNGVLTEWYSQLTWETERKSNADCNRFTYDPITQLIKSVSNPGMCLDAYQRQDGGNVHLYNCDASNENQQWVFNDITGQIHHANHHGYCLDAPTGANGLIHLWSCDKSNSNQQWTIKPVNA